MMASIAGERKLFGIVADLCVKSVSVVPTATQIGLGEGAAMGNDGLIPAVGLKSGGL